MRTLTALFCLFAHACASSTQTPTSGTRPSEDVDAKPRLHLTAPHGELIDLGPIAVATVDEHLLAVEAERLGADGFVLEYSAIEEVYTAPVASTAIPRSSSWRPQMSGGASTALIAASIALAAAALGGGSEASAEHQYFVRAFRFAPGDGPPAELADELASLPEDVRITLTKASTLAEQLNALHFFALAGVIEMELYESLRTHIGHSTIEKQT